MAQVLNLEIKSNDLLIANVYYRWSGYTNDSIELIKKILDDLIQSKQKTSKDSIPDIALRRVLTALHKTGAKFDVNVPSLIVNTTFHEDTKLFISNQIASYVNPADGTNGLISLTPDQMAITDTESQFTVTIHYDDLTTEFGTLDYYENVDELQDSFDMDLEDAEAVPLYEKDIDLLTMTREQISELEEAVLLAENHPFTCFRTPDGSYYSVIEG